MARSCASYHRCDEASRHIGLEDERSPLTELCGAPLRLPIDNHNLSRRPAVSNLLVSSILRLVRFCESSRAQITQKHVENNSWPYLRFGFRRLGRRTDAPDVFSRQDHCSTWRFHKSLCDRFRYRLRAVPAWPGWAVGLLFGLLISLPDAIITHKYVPILVLGGIGGLIIGGLIHGWKLHI